MHAPENLEQVLYLNMTSDNTADHDQSRLVRSYSVLTGIHLDISNKYGTPKTADHGQSSPVMIHIILTDI